MLFATTQAQKFLAFYSISFPVGVSDNDGWAVLNYWLTYCRKHCGLKSYIWVAERQQNKTVHYHLLTCDWMPIRKVNDAMRTILANFAKNHSRSWRVGKYNGVDVRNVLTADIKYSQCRGARQMRRANALERLSRYLTKYVTKSDGEFAHLAWHCSRCVSNLATGIIIGKDTETMCLNWIANTRFVKDVVQHNDVTVWIMRPRVNLLRDSDIYSRNDAVFCALRAGRIVPPEYYKYQDNGLRYS